MRREFVPQQMMGEIICRSNKSSTGVEPSGVGRQISDSAALNKSVWLFAHKIKHWVNPKELAFCSWSALVSFKPNRIEQSKKKPSKNNSCNDIIALSVYPEPLIGRIKKNSKAKNVNDQNDRKPNEINTRAVCACAACNLINNLNVIRGEIVMNGVVWHRSHTRSANQHPSFVLYSAPFFWCFKSRKNERQKKWWNTNVSYDSDLRYHRSDLRFFFSDCFYL